MLPAARPLHARAGSPTTVVFDAIVMIFVPLPLGLATRAFFDALTGARGSERVDGARRDRRGADRRAAREPVDAATRGTRCSRSAQALLARNLFAGVLRGYGRHGLPASAGEAISLFRDDPRTIADSLDAFADLICRVDLRGGRRRGDVADRPADDDRAARPDRC